LRAEFSSTRELIADRLGERCRRAVADGAVGLQAVPLLEAANELVQHGSRGFEGQTLGGTVEGLDEAAL
jgi:hypothetical protein